MTNLAHRTGALLIILLFVMAARPAPVRAQSCTQDVEPNEQPAAATPATLGCVEGAIQGADQDFFAFQFSAADAAQRWILAVGGVPGQLTTVQIFQMPADGSQPALVAKLDLPADAAGALNDLLFLPGAYVVGVGASGEGAYRLDWQAGTPLPPNGDAEPNDNYDVLTPLTGAFAISGDLQGTLDYYRWTVSESDAQQRWRLSARSPLGDVIYIGIDGPSGWPGVAGSTQDGGAFAAYELGLVPGDYTLSLSPVKDHATPYVLTAEAVGSRASDQEVEPNDRIDIAYPFDPGQAMHGIFQTPSDSDVYRFTADEVFAQKQWSLRVETEHPSDIYLCLLDAKGTEVQCRESAKPELPDLVLSPGDYGISVRDRQTPANGYTLEFKATGQASPDAEAEPNDLVTWAAPLNRDNALRGRLAGHESDYISFTVNGPAQLWRVQVAGEGLERLDAADVTGNPQQTRQAEGGRRIRLENLYLLPGVHYFRVVGQDGKYTMRAVPLGAPAEAPLSADQQAVFTSTTAPTATGEFDAGPPPIPVTEREPNDSEPLANRVELNTAQSGRLAEGDERDVYRFYLPAETHVRFTVLPPADAVAALSVDNILGRASLDPGEVYVYDAILPPGDHYVALTPNPRSDQPYQLWLQRINWFARPADLEPLNNSPLTAPLLAGSGVVTGTLDSSDSADFFRLPALPAAPAPITVTLQGTPWALDVYSGTETLNVLTRQPDNQAFTGLLPAGPLALRVYGTGVYTLDVQLADLPLPTMDPLPVTLAGAPAPALAAYWPYAQQLAWILLITNTVQTPQTLDLDFHTSDAAWALTPVRQQVSIAAGATLTVPVQLAVAYDARPGPVAIDVRARDARGAEQFATFVLEAVCGAAPVAPNRRLTTAGTLLGGLNVAWSGLGGRPSGDDPMRLAPLFDGIVAPSSGFRGAIGEAVTLTLPSTQPVPVAGVLLNPFGNTPPPDTLRTFAVATSLDGVTFTPVYTGVASLLPVEQAFAFDQPVPARAVRLTLIDSYNDAYWATVGLGEFKIVAAPGADLSDGRPFNLADPALGGHVVALTPLVYEPQSMLLDDQRKSYLSINDPAMGITTTLGFHHDRAAQIVELQWQNAADGDPAQRFGAVEVAVSMESPVGPWTPIGTWTLDPASNDVQRLALPTPLWARYVQLRVPAVGRTGSLEFPDVVRVIERSQDQDYTSILAEYGEYRREAIYEQQQAGAQPVPAVPAGGNTTRETAAALAVGQVLEGQVQANVRTDWYRIDVPAGQNVAAFTLTGEPALSVDAGLTDATGAEMPVERLQAGNTLQLKANVTPGPYYLQVTEPRRSVAFVWDTSGSVGPYTAIIYQALEAFTRAIDPQLEVVNLLPFGEPGQFLLPDWSGDPLAVQAALTNYRRLDSSSNAEWNLLVATDALGQRTGTRAAVLITDAESNGYDKTPELWAALDRVRPRVFSFEISSGGNAVSQDLMQDWANTNAGHYAHVTSIGDMETGFDRTACLLRQPARYTVAVDLRAEAPPTPAPTPTPEPSPTPAPTATPTPEPTPEYQGTGAIAVVAPTAAPGAPAGSAMAVGGAVEIILDASGSMLQRMEGQRKIEIARAVLTDLVNQELPSGAPVALRVFGNREADSCRTDLEIPLQPLDRAAATQILQGITAINLARTPIADSLGKVAEDLAGATGTRVVVLVTDGEETCGGDPAQVIAGLRGQGYDVRVNIVGFDVADPALQALFQQWATAGGGIYLNAANAAELGNAIVQAVRPTFRIVDSSGRVVGTGMVGGDPVTVPAGVYTVEVDTAPPSRVEQVSVHGDQTVQVELAGQGEQATPVP